jgi:hypothetical protein
VPCRAGAHLFDRIANAMNSGPEPVLGFVLEGKLKLGALGDRTVLSAGLALLKGLSRAADASQLGSSISPLRRFGTSASCRCAVCGDRSRMLTALQLAACEAGTTTSASRR